MEHLNKTEKKIKKKRKLDKEDRYKYLTPFMALLEQRGSEMHDPYPLSNKKKQEEPQNKLLSYIVAWTTLCIPREKSLKEALHEIISYRIEKEDTSRGEFMETLFKKESPETFMDYLLGTHFLDLMECYPESQELLQKEK